MVNETIVIIIIIETERTTKESSRMVRLATEEINIGYGDRPIVKDLSVQIPDRQITTIIGANGCGKVQVV